MSEQRFCAKCKWIKYAGGNVYRGPQGFCTRYAPKGSFPEIDPLTTFCGDFELGPEPSDVWESSLYRGKDRHVPKSDDIGKVADKEGTPVKLIYQAEDNWFVYLTVGVKHDVGIAPAHCFTVESEP